MSDHDDRDRWTRVQSVFMAVVDLSPEQRAEQLDALCGSDEALRAEVAALLDGDAAASRVLGDLDRLMAVVSEDGPDSLAPSDGHDPLSLVGSTVDHYRIGPLLGVGGMGVVYEALDTRLERKVALKFLPGMTASSLATSDRFVREARAASALDHPHICTVYEIGETAEGRPYISMTHYEGETLKQRLTRGPLEVAHALRYGAQIARALEASHAGGIIHRDIKPANIMLARSTGSADDAVVKILDFGLAKMVDRHLTRGTAVQGTLDYMSPEQTRGAAVDHTTDIWSLGVVLYESLTGTRPFHAGSDYAVMHAIQHRNPAPASSLRDDLAPEWDDILSTCLEKAPHKRYQDAGALAQDLEMLGALASSGPSSTLRTRQRRRRVGRRVLFGAGALAAGALIFALRTGPAAETVESMDLVVLPFDNLGASQQDQPLVDGLVHATTNTVVGLAQQDPRISVVPAQDVLRSGVMTTAAAVEAFRVAYVVTGAVDARPNELIVDLALVDGEVGRQQRTRRVRVTTDRQAELPDSLARGVTDLLSLDLDPDVRARLTAGSTRDPGAYRLFTEGVGLVQRYEEEANIDRGIERLEDALRQDSAYTQAYAALGEAYLRKYVQSQDKNPDWITRALEYGEEAIRRDPQLAASHATMGAILVTTGRYQDAVQSFQDALRLYPGDAFTHRSLGRAHQFLGNYEAAQRSYERAIELRPDYWDFHRALGFLFHAQGRHAEALVPYRRVIALAPGDPSGYNDLGSQLERLGRYDEALANYRDGARVNPEATRSTAFAYGNWGGIHFRRGEFQEAVRIFELSQRADPGSTTAWANLPASYYWAGRTDRARDAWLRVIELERQRLSVNPNDLRSMDRLADALAKTGQPDESLVVLGQIDTTVATASTLFSMTRTYEHLGRREEALSHLELALARGLPTSSLEFHRPWLENLWTDARFSALIQAHFPTWLREQSAPG